MIETSRIRAANPPAPISEERSVSSLTGTRIVSSDRFSTTFQPVSDAVAQ